MFERLSTVYHLLPLPFEALKEVSYASIIKQIMFLNYSSDVYFCANNNSKSEFNTAFSFLSFFYG